VHQRDLVGTESNVIEHDAAKEDRLRQCPQNWLLMNGECRSQRYSRLTRMNPTT
jgi:hypothetical protein